MHLSIRSWVQSLTTFVFDEYCSPSVMSSLFIGLSSTPSGPLLDCWRQRHFQTCHPRSSLLIGYHFSHGIVLPCPSELIFQVLFSSKHSLGLLLCFRRFRYRSHSLSIFTIFQMYPFFHILLTIVFHFGKLSQDERKFIVTRVYFSICIPPATLRVPCTLLFTVLSIIKNFQLLLKYRVSSLKSVLCFSGGDSFHYCIDFSLLWKEYFFKIPLPGVLRREPEQVVVTKLSVHLQYK